MKEEEEVIPYILKIVSGSKYKKERKGKNYWTINYTRTITIIIIYIGGGTKNIMLLLLI